MKFFDLLQYLNESPDAIFNSAPKKSIYTFIYESSVNKLISDILKHAKKRFKLSSKEVKTLKTYLNNYVQNKLKIKLNNPIMIFSGSDGKVYINNNLESSKKGVKYLTHNALVHFFVVDALESQNADEYDIENYDYYNYDFARELGKSGRITLSNKKELWPLISFWASDINNNDISTIINLSNKLIDYPNEINIEVNPLKNKYYDNGEVYNYSTRKKEKEKIKTKKTDDVIDAVRKRMFPDVESIQENIDDKLKEEIYKLFKKDNFNKKINFVKEQPSLYATKYVIKNIKDTIPCEGRYKNYKYYFAIKKINDNEFVIDLGNNFSGKIMPIVESLNGSNYTVIKKFNVKDFIKNYSNLKKYYK